MTRKITLYGSKKNGKTYSAQTVFLEHFISTHKWGDDQRLEDMPSGKIGNIQKMIKDRFSLSSLAWDAYAICEIEFWKREQGRWLALGAWLHDKDNEEVSFEIGYEHSVFRHPAEIIVASRTYFEYLPAVPEGTWTLPNKVQNKLASLLRGVFS